MSGFLVALRTLAECPVRGCALRSHRRSYNIWTSGSHSDVALKTSSFLSGNVANHQSIKNLKRCTIVDVKSRQYSVSSTFYSKSAGSDTEAKSDDVGSKSVKNDDSDSVRKDYSVERQWDAKTPEEVDEELQRYDYEDFGVETNEELVEEVVEEEEQLPVSLERGKTGVFDIEELVTLLKEENARDLCVIRVARELRYVDYLVIVTGRSTRHLKAMAEYIRWTYKKKRGLSDLESVKIEGQLSGDWFALDLGNIAVHLFLKETRELYDLEQLWTVGPEFDEKTRSTAADSTPAAFSLEDFSFDAELEKFRQLRQEQQQGSRKS